MASLCILLPNLAGGGVERSRLLLAEEFLQRGYEVEFVLLRAEGELIAEIPAGATVVDLGVSRIRQSFWLFVRYLRERKPVAVLASMWPLTGLAALARVISGLDCRLVVSEHTTLSGAPHHRGWSRHIHMWFGKRIYELCDHVVCVSDGQRQDLIAATGLSDNWTSVIYNPVRKPAPEPYYGHSAVFEWWQKADIKIIAVGSLKEEKDYFTLLHSIAKLRGERDVRLLILGEGPLRKELEVLATNLRISNYVMMPGFVRDPYPFLRAADLFVLSSTREGLGNVIIEALACGTPVISTDCPSGPAEILENGRYGRLIAVRDPDAMAKAMSEALDASHDREVLRSRALQFYVERVADQYVALLDPDGKIPKLRSLPS